MSSSLETLVRNYASGLVYWLTETKREADRTDDPFRRGQQCGYYMALFMLLNRARSSGIDLQALGLDGIDPDDLTD